MQGGKSCRACHPGAHHRWQIGSGPCPRARPRLSIATLRLPEKVTLRAVMPSPAGEGARRADEVLVFAAHSCTGFPILVVSPCTCHWTSSSCSLRCAPYRIHLLLREKASSGAPCLSKAYWTIAIAQKQTKSSQQLTVRVNSLYYRYVNYIEGQVPLFGDKGKPVQCRRGHATV